MNRSISLITSLVFILGLAACTEARKDPCQLLGVEDVRSVDNTVTDSIWAGRDGERKDDEVCMYHTDEGEPRLMLFVWYDKNADPETLVSEDSLAADARRVELSGIGSQAFAVYSDDELKLLAVKSERGVVGIRVRKPVSNDSDDFRAVARLAEKALSRNY